MKRLAISLSAVNVDPREVAVHKQVIRLSPDDFLNSEEGDLEQLAAVLGNPLLLISDIAPEFAEILSEFFDVRWNHREDNEKTTARVGDKASKHPCVNLLFNGRTVEPFIDELEYSEDDVVGFRHSGSFYRFLPTAGRVFFDGHVWRHAISAQETCDDGGSEAVRLLCVERPQLCANTLEEAVATPSLPKECLEILHSNMHARFLDDGALQCLECAPFQEFRTASGEEAFIFHCELLGLQGNSFPALYKRGIAACTAVDNTSRDCAAVLLSKNSEATDLFLFELDFFRTESHTVYLHQFATPLGTKKASIEVLHDLFDTITELVLNRISFAGITVSDVFLGPTNEVYLNEFTLRSGTVAETLSSLADFATKALHFDAQLLYVDRLLPHELFLVKTLIVDLQCPELKADQLLRSPIFFSSLQKAIFIEQTEKILSDADFDRVIADHGYDVEHILVTLMQGLEIISSNGHIATLRKKCFGALVRFFRNSTAHFTGEASLRCGAIEWISRSAGELYDHFERLLPGFFQICYESRIRQMGIEYCK